MFVRLLFLQHNIIRVEHVVSRSRGSNRFLVLGRARFFIFLFHIDRLACVHNTRVILFSYGLDNKPHNNRPRPLIYPDGRVRGNRSLNELLFPAAETRAAAATPKTIADRNGLLYGYNSVGKFYLYRVQTANCFPRFDLSELSFFFITSH